MATIFARKRHLFRRAGVVASIFMFALLALGTQPAQAAISAKLTDSFSPTTVGLSQPSGLTFNLNNTSGSTLSSLNFTAPLPTNLTVVAGYTPGQCGGTVSDTGTSVIFTGGTLTANTSCNILVNVSSSAAGTYKPDSAVVTGLNNVTTGAGYNATLKVVAASLSEAFNPTSIGFGGSSTLTLTITNGAGKPAQSGMAFTDTLPNNLTVAVAPTTTCASPATVGSVGQAINFSGGAFNLGDTNCTITVGVTSSLVGSYTNNNFSAVTNLDTSTATATLNVTAILSDKEFSPTTIGESQTSTLTFTISNDGTVNPATTGMGFTDTLPAGLTVASTPATPQCGGSVTGSAGTITFSGGGLLANQASCTITVSVTSTATGSYQNKTNNISGLANLAKATLNTTLKVTPLLSNKAFGVSYAGLNQPVNLTFTITNGTDLSAQTNLGFTDNLPSGLTVVTPVTTPQCGGTVASGSGGTKVVFSGGSLNLNDTGCTITVQVSAGTENSYSNIYTNISNLSNNLSVGTFSTSVVITGAHLDTATFDTSPINVNDSTTMTFTIHNNGLSGNYPAQTGMGFTDTLPSGLKVVNGFTPTQCGGTVSAPTGNTKVKLTGGTFNDGDTVCTVVVNVTTDTPGAYTNDQTDLSNVNNLIPNTFTSTLDVNPVLSDKEFNPTTIGVGGQSALTFTIDNGLGNLTQTGLGFTDNLPANLTVVSGYTASQCGGTVSDTGTVITFSGGEIDSPALGCTITLNVTSSNTGNYTNDNTTLSNPVNMSFGTVSTTLKVTQARVTDKQFSPTAIGVGGQSTLTITISNGAGSPAQTGLGFTDTLPSGLTVVSGYSTSQCNGTVSDTGTTLTLTGGSLNLNDTGCSVVANVTTNTPGNYTNNRTNIGSLSNLSKATFTSTLNVIEASLSNKAFSPTAIGIGGTSTLTFTISNDGTVNPAQSGLGFTDNLPSGVTVASAPTTPQCGGTVSGSGGTISLSGGSLASGAASCTINVDVTSSFPTTYTNDQTNISSPTNLTVGTFSTSLNVIEASLSNKAFSPTAIGIGGTSTLTFTISNDGTVNPAQSGLGFTDNLPSGVTVASAPTTPQCGGTVSGSGGTISLSGGSLASGAASCTISVDVTSSTPNTYTNDQTNISSPANLTVGTFSAQLTVSEASLSNKAFSPTTIGIGGTSTLTFTISNGTGNPAQTGLGFTDNLPSGVMVASAPTASQCGGTVSSTSTSVTLSGGTLADAAASCTITVSVTSLTPNTYTNDQTNISSPANLTVGTFSTQLTVSEASLSNKAFSPTAIGIGGTSTLTFTISNGTGNPAQSGLGFTDNLPSGVTVASAPTTPQCGGTVSGSGGTISLSGGSLASAAASCTISVSVTASTVNTYTNNQTNISSPANLTVGTFSTSLTVSEASLSNKAFSPTTIGESQTSTLTFTISNGAGNPAQSGLGFTDNLPSGVTVASAPTTPQCGGTVSGSSGTITFSGGSLASAAANCTISVSVTASTPNTYTNNQTNISSPANLTVGTFSTSLTVSEASLSNKAFSPTTINAGGTSTLTFTISNGAGNPAQSGLGFTDNLPSGVTVASAPTTPQCGGTVSGSGGTISLSGGSLASGAASCTISVSVTSGTANTYTNNQTNISSPANLTVGTFSTSLNVTAIGLSINDVSMNEGNSGTTNFVFTVTLSAPAGPSGVSFNVSTADGSATAPSDYTAFTNVPKSISSGGLSTTVTVVVNGDTTVEPDETFTVNVSSVVGAAATKGTGTGTIKNDDVAIPPVTLAPATLPGGKAGVAYSQTVHASGGVPPYTYVLGGTLPTGLSLSGATISGTPTATGSFPFSITANDSVGGGGAHSATVNYTIVIAAPTITLSPAKLDTMKVGVPFSQTVTVSGGNAPYTWSLSGTLPLGISFNNGVISGTPTATGQFNFTVSAKDSTTGPGSPFSASVAYSEKIDPPTVLLNPASPLPDGTVGTGYTATFMATGGTAPYTYTESGALPAGVTFSGNAISGTPTAAGTFTFSITAKDSTTGPGAPVSASKVYKLTIH